MPYQDRDGRFCGFLNIEETEGSDVFCRRYFLLDTVNAMLIYYMDSLANLPEAWRSPMGEIKIPNINKVSDGAKQRPKVPHCFSITVAGRQYFLQAEQDPDKWQWIEALNNASKITVPTDSSFVAPIKEWHGGDVSQGSYVTEIAGGVVCKMPIQYAAEPESDSISDDDESRSSSSGRLSPTSSRGLGSILRDGDKNKIGTPQRLRVIKSGYCVKQGAVRKNWKRRFFVLHPNGISYYKNEQDKQPIRTIPISEVLEARLSNEGSHPNRDNLFEIMTSKRIFFIQCDTPEDVKGWVDSVKTAIRHRRLEERKSMQDSSSQRHPLDEELSEGNYPSPIWRNRFMSAKERPTGKREPGRFPRQQDRSKKNLLLW